ncbi:MAG: ion transporter [Planctomycetota bacterium]
MPTNDASKAVPKQRAAWRDRLYEIIFEADTRAGQAFDVALLIAILLSILTISLETVEYFEITEPWPNTLRNIEWGLTILFTIEYLLRLVCVEKPLRYAFSFFGLIDLLACMPMYLSVLSPQSQSLMIFRSVRLLRVFRVLKMMRMLKEAHALQDAVWRARDKILVFIVVVLVAVTISGTLMYQVENDGLPDAALEQSDLESSPNGSRSKFTSIPMSMYWSVVTMTTVGYGDIVPETTIGKIISAILILLGYSLIIVPTGFVSAEMSQASAKRDLTARVCPHCLREGHSVDAVFCDMCGEQLLAKTHPNGTA